MRTVEIRYTTYLGSDCRRRHSHRRVGRWVTEFSVQLEIWLKDQWRPIIRYDTVHGFAHKDLISIAGKIKKVTLDNIQSFTEALTFAENDIKSNWEMYREEFLKEVNNER